MRYAHTNIIARDCFKLIGFYKQVFGCKSIGEVRNQKGEWLDRLTGLTDAHIAGEPLLLPGYGEDRSALEIYSYDHMEEVRCPARTDPGLLTSHSRSMT